MSTKKLLAVMLSVIMLFGSVPAMAMEALPEFNASGDNTGMGGSSTPSVPGNEGTVAGTKKDKLNGNVYWSLTSAGMLTISGTGDMMDFAGYEAPWNEEKQSVKFVYVSEGITGIGDYAFADLTKVSSVYIADSVKKIGANAFERCSLLAEINLPEALNSIGDFAFKNCTFLSKMVIPKDVTSIGTGAFSGCKFIEEFSVDTLNNHYRDIDGVLYSYDNRTLVSYPDAKVGTTYTVPQGVWEIAAYAFDDLKLMAEIKLPLSLKKISEGAFSECRSLKSLAINNIVSEIEQSAFNGCVSLERFEVGLSNQTFCASQGVLYDRTKSKLIKFPAKCTSACYEDIFTLPKSVKVIGQEAFADCSVISLMEIQVSLEEIEMGAFMNFDSLNEIQYFGTELNWKNIKKGPFNEQLDVVNMYYLYTTPEKEFNAKVGVTYYLEDFIDVKENEQLLESLVVTSTDPSVAAVDKEKMVAISEGEAYITAVAIKDGVSYAATVKVIVSRAGAQANDKEGTFQLIEGDKMDLKTHLVVPDEFLETLVWNTSNSKVVTVENGIVTAVGPGNAIVIATVDAEDTLAYSIRCEIKVEKRYTPAEYFRFSEGVITGYRGPDTEVIIPEQLNGYDVVEIAEYAFEDCDHVKKIELPSKVQKIGAYAFSGCSSLTNINLREGITYLGAYAFYKCTSLIKVKIPASLTSSTERWFAGCTKLNTIEFASGTTTIRSGIRGSSVKKVIIPSGVKTINWYAFDGCTSLSNVTLPNTLEHIGGYAFSNTNLSSITIPDSVTFLDQWAFSDCDNLSSVKIGKGLTRIYKGSFSGCQSLTNVTFSEGLTVIENSSFSDCQSLTKITLPNSLFAVGDSAFKGCSKLKEVNFGSGMNAISYYAFSGCPIEKVVIPDSLTKIYPSAFKDCKQLKELTLGANVDTIGSEAFAGCVKLEEVIIPARVREMGVNAFNGCKLLSNLIFEEGITTIGSCAFASCSKLAEVTLPDSVKTISAGAFKDCTRLSKIEFGENLGYIGNNAFENCISLTNIKIPDKVSTIGLRAFYYCYDLTDVTFGEMLSSLGSNAFAKCYSLKSVNLPKNLAKIDMYTFADCHSLEQVDLGNVTTIGSYAFRNCYNLEKVAVPDTTKAIGEYAFYGCSKLAELDFGAGLETIYQRAFSNCKALKSVVFPENVRSVSDYAFSYCSNLEYVEILNPACIFGYNVFAGCNKLDQASEVTASYKAVSDENIGYFQLEIEYDITGKNATGKTITINLPETTYLVEGSVKFNGQSYTNYTVEERAYYYNKIIINLEEKKGTFTFCVKPTQYGSLSTNATITTTLLGKETSKYIGNVYLYMPEVTVKSLDKTSKQDVIVEGTAIPKTNVNLYVDGEYHKSIYSGSSGTYKTTVNIGAPEDYREYTITAEVVALGVPYTADTKVLYVSDTPDLEKLSFNYGRKRYNKTEYILYSETTNITRPIILWGDYFTRKTDDYEYTFGVEISNRAAVDKVYVVSTRNNKKEYLEAVYNELTGKYVTTGYFTGRHDYIPGVLTVEYTKRGSDEKIPMSEINTYLDFENEAFLPSVVDYSAETFGAEVIVSEALSDVFGDTIRVKTEKVMRDYSEVPEEEYRINDFGVSSYDVTIENDEYVVNVDTMGGYMLLLTMHNITRGEMTTYGIEFVGFDEEGYENNLFVADVLANAVKTAGKMPNVFGLGFDVNNIKEGLMLAGLEDDELAAALEMAELLETKKQLFVLSAIVLSVSRVEDICAPMEILDVLLKAMEEDVDYFKQLRLIDTYKIGSECKVRWKIDPSGMVYEAVSSNPLEGVTATAYYVDIDDIPDKADGSGKDVDNIDPANINQWDAEEFGQINPIVTKADGIYAWDVPEGYWKVKFEKEGYETAYTDWLPVPPPQENINIGLVSKEAPYIESVQLSTEYAVVTFSKYMKPDTIVSINVGGQAYTPEYDESNTDEEGNVLAKEFTVNFGTELLTGTDYQVSVSGAKSYADVEMAAYSAVHKTPGEPLPLEVFVSDVTEMGNEIRAKFFNNSPTEATFTAICAIYDAGDVLVDIRMADVPSLGKLKDTTVEFTFEDTWESYKIFAWMQGSSFRPIAGTYDSKTK